jgi:hypothetical protein
MCRQLVPLRLGERELVRQRARAPRVPVVHHDRRRQEPAHPRGRGRLCTS